MLEKFSAEHIFIARCAALVKISDVMARFRAFYSYVREFGQTCGFSIGGIGQGNRLLGFFDIGLYEDPDAPITLEAAVH